MDTKMDRFYTAKRVALVISIAKYNDPRMPDAYHVRSDAGGLCHSLLGPPRTLTGPAPTVIIPIGPSSCMSPWLVGCLLSSVPLPWAGKGCHPCDIG